MADYFTIFTIGLLSSFGHCLGMCGGFVMAYSMQLKRGGTLVSPHVLYNIGRVVTYMLLGVLFGLVGETLRVVVGIRQYQGILQLIAGIFMVLIALEMGGWLPGYLSNALPGYRLFKKGIGYLLQRVNRRNVLLLGFFNGFIPCGLVYAAGAKAASSGSIPEAVLTMLFFGLGTFPAMMALGLSANTVSIKFRQRVFRAATLLVILFGVFTVYRGIYTLANPVVATASGVDLHCVPDPATPGE